MEASEVDTTKIESELSTTAKSESELLTESLNKVRVKTMCTHRVGTRYSNIFLE